MLGIPSTTKQGREQEYQQSLARSCGPLAPQTTSSTCPSLLVADMKRITSLPNPLHFSFFAQAYRSRMITVTPHVVPKSRQSSFSHSSTILLSPSLEYLVLTKGAVSLSFAVKPAIELAYPQRGFLLANSPLHARYRTDGAAISVKASPLYQQTRASSSPINHSRGRSSPPTETNNSHHHQPSPPREHSQSASSARPRRHRPSRRHKGPQSASAGYRPTTTTS